MEKHISLSSYLKVNKHLCHENTINDNYQVISDISATKK